MKTTKHRAGKRILCLMLCMALSGGAWAGAVDYTCPDCGKFLLLVKGKRGEMLVCPDRECGYRKSVTQVTNARCPNCFKKMELRGEGENQMFACVCGYREKLSAFQERRKSAGAGKRDVAKYLQQQKDDKPVNSGMADALAKWLEKNQK